MAIAATDPLAAAMQYVHRVKGRDGRDRLYLRKQGLPRMPLKSAWDSAELAREVEALLGSLTAAKPLPGLLRGALRRYELEDADFKGLAESTKALYRVSLKEFELTLGDVPIAAFTPAFILELRNAWAERGHRAANVRLQVLKNVLWPCVIAGQIEGGDPSALVPHVRRPAHLAEPHILWPLDVVESVIAGAMAERKPGVARAVAIARYTGARRKDLVGLTRAARREGRFAFLSGKRRVPVDVPEDPDLTRWLARLPDRPDATPRAGRQVTRGAAPTDTLHLVFNLAGRPYTESGLGQEIAALVQRLQAAGLIDSDSYDLHGLRHTRGVELALAGCTDAEGAAQMGHASPSSFAQYRRQADRLRMSDHAADKIARLRAASASVITPVQLARSEAP